MTIQVLGAGCIRCDQLYENAKNAIALLGDPSLSLEKVSDPTEFAKVGVFMTPALVIDGKAVSIGKVLSKVEIADLIRKKES